MRGKKWLESFATFVQISSKASHESDAEQLLCLLSLSKDVMFYTLYSISFACQTLPARPVDSHSLSLHRSPIDPGLQPRRENEPLIVERGIGIHRN